MTLSFILALTIAILLLINVIAWGSLISFVGFWPAIFYMGKMRAATIMLRLYLNKTSR